jgi:membrane protein YdbS with pleckstrin-like domain
MKLTPPKSITFWIAVILGLLGFIGSLVKIPFVSTYAFWFELAAFVLLVLGLLVKGL